MIGKHAFVISLIFAYSSARGAPAPDAPKYPLLNPLLEAEEAVEFSELRRFDYKLKTFAEERRRAGLMTHLSVYFRDLENGPVFGLKMEEKYSPVSLLKVPLMMATLKAAQTDPELLKRRVRNAIPSAALTHFGGRVLTPGADYSVDEVLRAMIAASDNDAVVMLRALISTEDQDEVYRDFGLIIPGVRSLDDSMTVREYAAFYRILYNASYLDKSMSQKALEYLTASEFKGGLVAGLPPGTVVAHKFGERFFIEGGAKQLHDCGIIYHPARHYVLCVMSRGDDFDKLLTVIQDLSALVYAEVDTHQKP